jgi:hypothetical protein
VDAHRPPPRSRRRTHRQAPAGSSHGCSPRDDVIVDSLYDGGDDPGQVGGVVGLLLQAQPAGEDRQGPVEPRGERPRRREPDELPGVRRRAQLHDAHAVGVGQGAGAGAAPAPPAATAAESGPGEAAVLVRVGPEHRQLGQEPLLEGRGRPVIVVAGGHARGVGGRWPAPVHALHRRPQRGLHRLHAGRDQWEAVVQVASCLFGCMHSSDRLLDFDALLVLGIRSV